MAADSRDREIYFSYSSTQRFKGAQYVIKRNYFYNTIMLECLLANVTITSVCVGTLPSGGLAAFTGNIRRESAHGRTWRRSSGRFHLMNAKFLSAHVFFFWSASCLLPVLPILILSAATLRVCACVCACVCVCVCVCMSILILSGLFLLCFLIS